MEDIIGFPVDNDEREEQNRNNGQAITLPMSIGELKKLAKVEKLKLQKLPNSGTRVAYVSIPINKRATIVPIWIGERVDTDAEMSVVLYREGERFYGLVSNSEDGGEL